MDSSTVSIEIQEEENKTNSDEFVVLWDILEWLFNEWLYALVHSSKRKFWAENLICKLSAYVVL